MRHSSRFILATCAGLALYQVPASAIFQGTAVPKNSGLLKQVMSVGRWLDADAEVVGGGLGFANFPGDKLQVGTTVTVKHEGISQRCMITARHLPTHDLQGNPEYHRTVMGKDVRQLTPDHRDQLVAATDHTRGGGAGDLNGDRDVIDSFRDIRINWLENREDDGEDKRLRLEDYTGVPIQPSPFREGDVEAAYEMIGYGMRDEQGQDNESGILREGHGGVVKVMVRPEEQGGGSRMHTEPGEDPLQAECKGDSGLAARVEGQEGIFSTLSIGEEHCDPGARKDYPNFDLDERTMIGGTIALHSLLDDRGVLAHDPEETDWATVGNWQQVKYLISKVCTKEVRLYTEGSGKITGQITGDPLPAYPGSEKLNHKIDCEGDLPIGVWAFMGDCVESVHQPESLTVTATPADGWAFKEWRAAAPMALVGDEEAPRMCPCAPTEQTCKFEFDEIGDYGPDHSLDLSVCAARFEPNPHSTPSVGGVLSIH